MWFWNCRKQETGEALVVSSCACACEEVSFANCYYRDAIFWSKDHATEDLPHFSIVHTVLPHSRQIYVHHMERFFSSSYGRGGEIAMTNDYELLKRYFSSPTNYCCKTTKSVLIDHVTNNGTLENKTMVIIPLVLFTLQYQLYFILSLPKQVIANIFSNEFLNILSG